MDLVAILPLFHYQKSCLVCDGSLELCTRSHNEKLQTSVVHASKTL